MATTTSARGDSAPGFGERIGHFRWVICGLLFFATTINYIDRQVLGILAPDLQKEVGWTELDYGRIVIAFQASYAVMMLVWGRSDLIGTRAAWGSVLWWPIAAMGTAFARARWASARCGSCRRRRGRQFSGVDQDRREWFPKSERAFATGSSTLHQHRRCGRADLRAADSPRGLAHGLHPHRRSGSSG